MGQNRGFRRRRVKPAALVSFRTCVRPFTRRELTCCFFVRGSNVFSSILVALALILSSLVVATPAAHAQAQTAGEITGQVLDPSKAAISNAAVTATNSATGAVRKAQTDSQGHYALTDLPVGTYSVTVEHEGFQQLTANRCHVERGDNRHVELNAYGRRREPGGGRHVRGAHH